ncbi:MULTISPECIES: thiol peroxidase [unclassified Spiroplasma]|uniref:thiol peroxidase n=1 Tax=unclassified Spiroplasma TaxID=2637901 RepID=UPI0027DF75F3|nr:thiol peroxidase [Spiroplasma sp. AdecLV25b]
MIQLTIKGNPVHIKNNPIKVGDILNFTAVDNLLREMNLTQFPHRFKIISSVPSIDTKTCALQTAYFNAEATKLQELVVITISKDLPFAQSRFCENLKLNGNFHIWSDYRNNENNFSNKTNLLIDETQLLARSVMVLDDSNKILYLQIVKEVSDEPDYDQILKFLKTLN